MPDLEDATPGGPARARFWREAAAVAALALALNLVGNGRTSLYDRDEPRYAGCTREMRARGDWVFPTFNAEPRFHKPVLIYWLMRGGFAVGGVNAFGARLVSAMAGAGTCVLVLVLGRRMIGPRGGRLAAVILATSPIMVIESKLATTDATLTLWLVGALSCLRELSQRPSRRLAAAFWVLMALATLTKGPVGPALVACAGVASWRLGGPPSAWGRLHWRWGVPLFVLVTAPWFVAVGVASRGEFFRFAVGKQVAERVVSGVEQHGGFPGYYVVSTLLLFYPWSGLLPAALAAAWSRRKADPELAFLVGWVVGPWVLLECVRTKLVHYYLPAYPACALLAAWLLGEVGREGTGLKRWPLGRLGYDLMGGVGVALAAACAAGAVVLPAGMGAPCVATGLVIVAGALRAALRLRLAGAPGAGAGLAASSALTMALIGGWLLPAAEPYRLSRVVGERLARLSDATHAPPVLLSFQEPAVVWAMDRPAVMMRTWPRFFRVLDRERVLATAVTDGKELADFRARGLDVDVRETVRGFNPNKGRVQTLHLALIRRKAVATAVAPRTAVR